MSHLVLDAEALYQALLTGVSGLLRPGVRLIGVTSGGCLAGRALAARSAT